MKHKKVTPSIILSFFFALVFLLLAGITLRYLRDDTVDAGYYSDLRAGTVTFRPIATTENPNLAFSETVYASSESTADFSIEEEVLWIPDSAYLQSINEDYIGWIRIPESPVDYPVVKGSDNCYYLTHRFDHAESGAGCIFADADSVIDNSDVLLLYGHARKDGSMFRSLLYYAEQAGYADTHSTIQFTDSDGVLKTGSIFSVFYADAGNDRSPWEVEFGDRSQKSQWMNEMKNRSLIDFAVCPGENDPILILSTCSFKGEDGRFLVMAVLDFTENSFE